MSFIHTEVIESIRWRYVATMTLTISEITKSKVDYTRGRWRLIVYISTIIINIMLGHKIRFTRRTSYIEDMFTSGLSDCTTRCVTRVYNYDFQIKLKGVNK